MSNKASHSPPNTVTVATVQFSCDGIASKEKSKVEHSLGHPRVYLNISASGQVDCPYCGIHYQLAAGAARASAAH